MKLSTVAMFGAGYLLGTRAGRQRYEQLREAARRVAGELDASSIRSGELRPLTLDARVVVAPAEVEPTLLDLMTPVVIDDESAPTGQVAGAATPVGPALAGRPQPPSTDGGVSRARALLAEGTHTSLGRPDPPDSRSNGPLRPGCVVRVAIRYASTRENRQGKARPDPAADRSASGARAARPSPGRLPTAASRPIVMSAWWRACTRRQRGPASSPAALLALGDMGAPITIAPTGTCQN